MTDAWLETVTHARLRAQQGDAGSAERILRAVLARRPGDPEALALLAELPGGRVPPPEPGEPTAEAPVTAAAADLAAEFRQALRVAPPPPLRSRLLRFLDSVRSARGERHAE